MRRELAALAGLRAALVAALEGARWVAAGMLWAFREFCQAWKRCFSVSQGIGSSP